MFIPQISGADDQREVQSAFPRPQAVNRPQPRQPAEDPSVFIFEIDWEPLEHIRTELQQAEDQGVLSNPSTVDKLKLEVARQLKKAYINHHQVYTHLQKTPGREIYRKVTNQIFQKFPTCIKDVINGKVLGTGREGFLKAFELCNENMMRSYQPASRAKKAKQGRGTVGVIMEEYEPALTEPQKEEQIGIKQYLKNLSEGGQWDQEEVEKNMGNSYKLQRLEILEVRDEVEGQQDQNEDEEDVALENRALAKLITEWPFLFKKIGLTQHFIRLTGKDMRPEIARFILEDLDHLILYLTSKSPQAVKNLKIRLEMDKFPITISSKLMAAIMMLGKHFTEATSNFIKTVEVSERKSL